MERLRTFGIVAHIDAGKTTLTERILFDAGAQSWLGSVDDGTATMDWMPAERSRGISITAAASRVEWAGHVLQVVDTPGHVDFVAEVERCLHVLDAVIVLLDGVRGVESQTEAVWEQAGARGLPRLVFVNKLDREGADFHQVVDDLAKRLGCRALPLVVPLTDGAGAFSGLGDALTGGVQWFDGRPSADVAAAIGAQLLRSHERVVEFVADHDDGVLADALAERRVVAERLRPVLRAEFLAGRVVLVLGGAALWNRGVDWLLDAVVAYFPRPAELPRQGLWSVERAGDPSAPFCGLVFKVQHLEQAWNFVRIVRGQLAPGSVWVRGRSPGVSSVCAEVWLVQADRHVAARVAQPGEIVVLPGEFGLRTGDTVCDPSAPVVLPMPRFPAPVLATVFEPERAEDRSALAACLRDLAVDDPTLRVDGERDRLLVRGMGELHLEIVADLVRSRTGITFQCSRPQVDRRESVKAAGRGEAEVRAFVGGVECGATCIVRVAPADSAAVAVVVDEVGTDSSAVAVAELRLLATAGRRVGPMQGMSIVLEDARSSGGAPSGPLLAVAAARALDQAMELGGHRELEPWVVFEVGGPEDSATAVLADLASRGAEVHVVASGRLGAKIGGLAPLSRMLGYVTRLRSLTRGRGRVIMRPSGLRDDSSR